MRRRSILAAVLFAALAGCATIPRFEAANDIHAFLVSIRDGDRATFDAHVDKSALKEQLRARFLTEAQQSKGTLGALGALVTGPLIDLGVDTLVRPDVFRAVAVEHGYAPDSSSRSTASAPASSPRRTGRAYWCSRTRLARGS
jgi:hypothetical protein